MWPRKMWCACRIRIRECSQRMRVHRVFQWHLHPLLHAAQQSPGLMNAPSTNKLWLRHCFLFSSFQDQTFLSPSDGSFLSPSLILVSDISPCSLSLTFIQLPCRLAQWRGVEGWSGLLRKRKSLLQRFREGEVVARVGEGGSWRDVGEWSCKGVFPGLRESECHWPGKREGGC